MSETNPGRRSFLSKLAQGLLLLAILSAMMSVMVNLAANLFMRVYVDDEFGIAEELTVTVETEASPAASEQQPGETDVPSGDSLPEGEQSSDMEAMLSELEKYRANERTAALYATGMYAGLALLFLIMAFTARSQWKMNLWRYGAGFVLFGVCAVLFLTMEYEATFLPVSILHAIALAMDHVFSLLRDHRARNSVFRVIFLLLIIAALFLAIYDSVIALLSLLSMTLIRIFYYIMRISFSQLKLDVLKRILKKTYAAEIVLGMLMLIIAFSIVLPQFEDGIPTFGNALWYCFAIVTTIGFGDVTAVTIPGRVISVILGVYGIIVVALITSIIVNFYTETKNDNESKNEAEAKNDEAKNADETKSEEESK